MKNIKKILTLGLALGVFAGGMTAIANSKNGMKVAKATDPVTYIEMSDAAFTAAVGEAGTFAAKDATYWPTYAGYHGEDGDSFNYPFQALDTFFRGESNEGWTGTLTLKSWTQYSQYVYFTWGGARDYDVSGDVKLVFHYGEYSYTMFNNTFMDNQMLLRYFKIPNAQYDLLDKINGFSMYIELVDDRTNAFGFHNFGYLHPNQTLESTADAMRYYLNMLSTDSRVSQIRMRKAIMNNYFTNSDANGETGLKNVFFSTVSDISDSFSTNADFLKHWYFDHNYFNNDYGPARHFDTVISSNEYRPDAPTNMPFNNDGGFFRGWYEDAEGHKSGFVASDGLRYRFVSRPFVLSGTGIVSIKMAGKASLHVLDATVQNTDAQAADLAWIDNRAMQDSGSQTNIADSGFNTCTMVNHVINLEAYLGKTIQLAICDRDTSGWSAAYFDELVTNYASNQGFKVDVATQENTSGTFYPVYFDKYVSSANTGVTYTGNAVNYEGEEGSRIVDHVDNSAFKAAHEVWMSYINTVRNGKEGLNDICGDKKTSDGVKTVIGAYAALSEAAQRVVCASYDFSRGSGTWYEVNPTLYGPTHEFKLSRTIQYLADLNGVSTVTYSNGIALGTLGFQMDGTAMIIVAISTVIALIAFGLAFYNKKKKANR